MESIKASHIDVELEPYSLSGGNIVAGDPRPRGTIFHRSQGSGLTVVAGVYACDPGVIRNEHWATETIHVIEGEVRIELDGGATVELGPGGLAVVPAGSTATWTFRSVFREVFVLAGFRPAGGV